MNDFQVTGKELNNIIATERRNTRKALKEKLIKKIEGAMIKVPETRNHNTPEDSYFNLGLLKAEELLKSV
jgi:hypothetical protein